jgi:DNA-binding protein H-NS
MARPSNLEKMTYAELAQMEVRIQQLKAEKQDAERAAVRQKIASLAKQHGFDIRELLDGRRKGKGKGSVAPKYRDHDNPANTWTGRGRMPRWLTAATKGGRAKKEDFLIK